MSSKYTVDSNVLTIKTVQIAPFRTLMTALKDILLETNITFQKDGIRIINMDKSHTILAHLFLRAENFELYECKEEKIIIGVNMFHLFKLINSIDNDDTLTIYIENAPGGLKKKGTCSPGLSAVTSCAPFLSATGALLLESPGASKWRIKLYSSRLSQPPPPHPTGGGSSVGWGD